MKCFSKWICATLAIALLAGAAMAADAVTGGKVKSINADNKTFVMTDSSAKEWTFKFGDHLVINRGDKESKSDLKVGDVINVCYGKDPSTWTAHYILVQEGSTKNSGLVRGNVKSYDADKKQLIFTGENAKSSTFAMGDAKVRLNMKASTVEDIKSGDHALLIVETTNTKATLKSVMVERK